MKLWDHNKIELLEEGKILLLNRANAVLGVLHASVGGVTGTVIDPKIVFITALKANACGIILAHNHPSGSLLPSEADTKLTGKINEGARLLDMRLLDHLIVTPEGYFSYADQYGL